MIWSHLVSDIDIDIQKRPKEFATFLLTNKSLTTFFEMSEEICIQNWNELFVVLWEIAHPRWPEKIMCRFSLAGDVITMKESIFDSLQLLRRRLQQGGQKRTYDDHVSDRGHHSWQPDNLTRASVWISNIMRIPTTNTARDNERDKLKNFSSWTVSKKKRNWKRSRS